MMNKLLLTILYFVSASSVFAQTSITGIVKDIQGEAIIGATVQEKGMNNYAITDIEGRFVIVPKQDLPITLQVDAVGLKSQVIEIFEIYPEPLYISLKLDNVLEEVVVVGYGEQKKSELTGSISSVPKGLIEQQPVSSLDRALQGAVAGVQVTQTSGQPGGGVSVRIRGGASIQGGNEPLYVIDGFPIYNDTDNTGVTSGAPSNALSSINPNDIESIDILKDASATAIYGSRGANGVVIIATKRGKAGESSISYEGSYGIQKLRKKIDLLNAKEFALLRNDVLFDTNPSLGRYQYLSKEEIDQLGPGTDWQEAAFQEAPMHSHQLTFLGGNEKIRYSITGNYFDQDGILLNTGFRRLSSRVNLDITPTQKLTLGTSLTLGQTRTNIAANVTQGISSSIVTAILSMPPTATIYEPDGSYTLRNPFENIISNPIATLEERINQSSNLRILGTVFGQYEIAKDLLFKVSFGADISNSKDNSYLPLSLYEGSLVNGQAQVGASFVNSWLNENTVSYSRVFNGIHSFNSVVGFTQQEYTREVARTGSQQFVSDALSYHSLQSGSVPLIPYSIWQDWVLHSFLGRINYNYDQRYYFTASVRSDGSSRFGGNNKWGYFPSVGFSWRVSNEDFFRKVNAPMSDLKIRASYGATGNQEIGVYQSLSTLTSVNYLLGDQIVTGFMPERIANNDLGWETTYQLDIGLDVGLFENRVLLTLDGYHKRTEDLLLNVEIPWTSGYSTSLQNFGSVENKGVELSINTVNFEGDFNWNTNLNFSFNRNKVTSLGNFDEDFYISGNYIIKVGEPLGTFYGTVTDGILHIGEEDIKGVYTGNANPKPGDRRYKDINGDGQFTTAADRTIIGNAQPDYIFGITNNFSWKGFDLSIFFQGSIGNEILNENNRVLQLFNGQQNAAAIALERWTEDNPSASVPRAKLDPAPVFSDQLIEDGSFARLKNLTIGYTLPEPFIKRIGLSKVRVYASGYNLLTWTKYSGFDPDVTSADNTVSQGTDAGVYPVAKTISTGLNITF